MSIGNLTGNTSYSYEQVKTQIIPFSIFPILNTFIKVEDSSIKNSYERRFKKLVDHLSSLKSKNIVNDDIILEILSQFRILELRRHELTKHNHEIVVVSNGELFFGKDLTEAIRKARTKYGKRPYYSESIDMVEYPSIFE